jgi:branched-chain amino acid transport system substrate-binding protein
MKRQGQGNTYFKVLFLTLLLLGAAACTTPAMTCEDELGCIAIGRREPVRIGVMTALSGEAAYLGRDIQRGIELAAADRGSTLLDHQLQLVVTDSGCDEKVAAVAAKIVIEDEDVLAVLGPTCSVSAETAVPIIEAAGLSLISPAASAARLTNPNKATGGVWRPGFFRTAASDAYQAELAANFAFDQLNARTAAIIYDETDVNNSLHQIFADTFRQRGGQITFQSSISAGDSGVADLLRVVGAATPDLLYLPLFEPEGNLIANYLPESASLNDVILLGSSGLFTPSFPIGASTPNLNNMYLVGPVQDGAAYEAFLEHWQSRYNQPPYGLFHAQAYDAMNLLLNAIETTAQVDNRGNLLIGLSALRQALAQTEGYAGVSGTLTCSPYGDCAAPDSLGVYQISREVIAGERWPPELVWRPGEE